jgi:GAF domain-containing protein
MSEFLDGRKLETLKQAVEDAARALPPSAFAQAPISAAGKIDQTAVAFNVFSRLLYSDGIRAALYAVLRNSSYRFLSIFRFQNGLATSCVHVDRENLADMQAGEVTDTATYCCYVRDSGGAFVTADASSDPRTANHPAHEEVRSYCGIPIIESDGTLIGTLCHYDLVPRDPNELNLELLLQVSSALARSGLVPPYPDAARGSTPGADVV